MVVLVAIRASFGPSHERDSARMISNVDHVVLRASRPRVVEQLWNDVLISQASE